MFNDRKPSSDYLGMADKAGSHQREKLQGKHLGSDGHVYHFPLGDGFMSASKSSNCAF